MRDDDIDGVEILNSSATLQIFEQISDISLFFFFLSQHVRIPSFSWTIFFKCLRAHHDDCDLIFFFLIFENPQSSHASHFSIVQNYKEQGATIIIMYYSGDATRPHHSHSCGKKVYVRVAT